MSVFDNSFVMLGDDAIESVPVSGSFKGETIYASFTDSVTVETMADNNVFESHPSVYGEHSNGFGIDGSINGVADGPILPHPSAMEPEEGFAVREWRRQNAILLEEKERREKELRIQVIEEAEHYKAEFHKKREITTENNKITNREKEKLFLTREETFNAEADKDYWKAIAELIPKEVSTVEKRHRKKDDDKKQPSIAVVRGPKPGKPTDLARMRQILLKLKHNPPPHLKTLSSSPSSSEDVAPENVVAAATSEAVVAA